MFDVHYQEMEKELKKMKKLKNIKNDDFRQVQDYFMDKSIEKARMAFKFRSQMLENVPGNFKNKFKKEEGTSIEIIRLIASPFVFLYLETRPILCWLLFKS